MKADTKLIKKIFLFILLPLFFTNILQAISYDLDTHIMIRETREPKTPFVWKGYIVFSYASKESVGTVSAVFDHENFRKRHPFIKNEHGVYLYLMPRTSEISSIGTLKYRYIVDNLWISDPKNQSKTNDGNGIYLSNYRFKESELVARPSPIIDRAEGKITFYVKTEPNSTVYLVGSFNYWDPYSTRMEEVATGMYEITLSLERGKSYYYYFSVNGHAETDPTNEEIRTNRFGERVSLAFLP